MVSINNNNTHQGRFYVFTTEVAPLRLRLMQRLVLYVCTNTGISASWHYPFTYSTSICIVCAIQMFSFDRRMAGYHFHMSITLYTCFWYLLFDVFFCKVPINENLLCLNAKKAAACCTTVQIVDLTYYHGKLIISRFWGGTFGHFGHCFKSNPTGHT